MKNMFLVINKEKVYAYVVSIFTIITLFFMSNIINSRFDESEETSANMSINNIASYVTNNVVNSIISNETNTNTSLNK